MYSNEKHFTKEPFEDNGRCKIHPLSEEGLEHYLSKESYNYNFIRTKKNPELLKQIEEEIKAENASKQKKENINSDKGVQLGNQEDLKEENKNPQNNNSTKGKTGNKSKNKKGKNLNTKKNYSYINQKNNSMLNKDSINKGLNKNNNKRKQSPGARLANTIDKLGKVSQPIIRNVDNDRGKLWEYPQPYIH